MNLPMANSNEELSTISENFFKPLFDVQKFYIRSEQERDKGIDFQIEIKKQNQFTNFRFAIQLKATDSIAPNQDGSISLQLDTSNINYLLNNPMPAYYVLYFKQNNHFYYESINDFAKTLYEKNTDWNKQKSHVLRFSKLFDSLVLEEIYAETLKKGKFQRIVSEKLIAHSTSINSHDRVSVDTNFNVIDDAEIRELIENIGLVIINEGNWKDIITVHKKATGNIASTSKYNLVLGIANYYSGSLTEALSFFRNSINLKTELPEDLLNHLLFFEATVKYSIGLISENDFEKRMELLENAENIGFYIKLEKAKKNYLKSLDQNPNDRFENFVVNVEEIIDNPKVNESIKLNAKCELILFEGFKKNMDYVKSVAMINALEGEAGVNIKLRTETANKLIEANNKWYKNAQETKKKALDRKDNLAYFNIVINELKVAFDFEVCTDNIFVGQDFREESKLEKPNKMPMFEAVLIKISEAIEYYHHINHTENIIAALSTKYEILHYLERFEEASSVLLEIETIIELYDLTEQRRKFEYLKNGGATHQRFNIFLDEIFGGLKSDRKEFDELKKKMVQMDKDEKENSHEEYKSNFQIHLFPIGSFQFPIEKKLEVYEILNITNEAREVFDMMFENVIPVANIFYDKIIQEGFVDGNVADIGIKCWRNIYKIRKAFYENKFYRIELK